MTGITHRSTTDPSSAWTNLASAELGAEVLYATDDFFAEKERMLLPSTPVFVEGLYTDHGKWMDGWESRRKRAPGHDWAIVRLGVPGRIREVDIDTSFFVGNYPPHAALEACVSDGAPDEHTRWTVVLPKVALDGNARNRHPVHDERAWTHVRLHIHPDGGVARLRVFGSPALGAHAGVIDLAAMAHGGRVLACSDQHFGPATRMLAPGRGENMGDGWETRRKRVPGNDWAIVKLAAPGRIERVVLDTCHFKGNYPDRFALQAADLRDDPAADTGAEVPSQWWPYLLGEQKLQADHEHVYVDLNDLGVVTHVRVSIFPDGG
ncbi:MAG TPA: allantoicase, partial [Myxococcota bacterium]|nr:allantoicase [Myxococcota bacterium]